MFRFFSNVWGNFKEYIVLVVLLIIGLITLSLNQKPAAKKVKSLAFGSFAAFTSVISNVFNVAGVRSENEELRKLNADLMLQVSELRKYGIENSELKGLLALKDTTRYPLIPAAIVSKSLSKSQSTFTLNAGKRNGVLPGMPVINDHGLVGIVNSTSDDFSIVRTLKNLDLKLTVKDERSRVDGIMKWDGSDLVMIDIPKTYDIEPGDRIITSELSSIVDIPIPIGIVLGLSKVETGIFNEVKIKPFVDFIRTEHVFVIGIVENKIQDGLQLNFYKRNKPESYK
ncbi:MAG: rod shape-determining protein MreC [Bacteroidetes bacterium]|nr:rod shape-determining protein MreC [Bacteroidota bacterium]